MKWTFDSLLQGKIRSTKAAVYRFVDHIDAPDDATVIFHMKEAGRHVAVESFGRSDRHCPVWQRRGDDAASHRLGAVQVRQRGDRSRGRCSNATTTTGARRPSWRGCALRLCRTRPRRRWKLRKGSGDVADQLTDARHGAYAAARSISCRGTRRRNAAGVHGIQPARSHSERCARAAGDCVCHSTGSR